MVLPRCAALAVVVSLQPVDGISLLRGPKVSPLPYENHHEHQLMARDPRTDRLSESCEEPKNPARVADGEGPVTVTCCHSAKSKVEHFLKRQKDCHDAVPCSKSWEEMLPSYIDYYKELEAKLCKPRPTTTTTTTTTWTIPPLKEKEEPKPKEEKEKKPEAIKEGEDPLAWCKEPCLELATDDKAKCEALCEELEGKVDDKMAAAGCEAKSGTVTKVTKVTKVTSSDGETKVTKEETVSKEGGDGAKDEAAEEEPADSAEESKEEAKEEEPAEDAKAEEPEADAKAEEEPKADEKADEEAPADEEPAEADEEAGKDEGSE